MPHYLKETFTYKATKQKEQGNTSSKIKKGAAEDQFVLDWDAAMSDERILEGVTDWAAQPSSRGKGKGKGKHRGKSTGGDGQGTGNGKGGETTDTVAKVLFFCIHFV